MSALPFPWLLAALNSDAADRSEFLPRTYHAANDRHLAVPAVRRPADVVSMAVHRRQRLAAGSYSHGSRGRDDT